MASESDKAPSDWMSYGEAREYLAMTRSQFNRVASSGALTKRQYPKCRPTFLRESVERLAAESIRPAVALAG